MDKHTFLSAVLEAGCMPLEPSVQICEDVWYTLVKYQQQWQLCLSAPVGGFCGQVVRNIFLCSLCHENCVALQQRFAFLRPVSPRGKRITIGLGDRLGVCTAAHLQALKGTQVFPVLAQQSMRELSLTGRSNTQMLDDVVWQVFACGYQGGYAADGDHRKTLEQVQTALHEGSTMITLDCSDYIDNRAALLSAANAAQLCREIYPAQVLSMWYGLYCGKHFPLCDGSTIYFPPEDFDRMLLTYGKAIDFIRLVYLQAIDGSSAAFEVSIDETAISTQAYAHYFVAAELKRLSVSIDSMAPRFCGEFQKGIDYIGDISKFESEFRTHKAIADTFGYRLSVHSGSDKFSVFPAIGALSKQSFHLKTSGTSWVEATRVIAICDAALFRQMVYFSCLHFEEAKKHYHVTAQLSQVADVDALTTDALPSVLDQPDTRQVLHIAYGFLLAPENGYRQRIYQALDDNRDCLMHILSTHIRKHLIGLGICDGY